MKTLNALTCTLAALTFSAIAQAAPVQYQLTALHTSESSVAIGGTLSNPVNSSDYFFEDGTPITATFYYDSAVAPTYTNLPVTIDGSNGTYTALRSTYSAFSNITFEVAGHSIEVADQILPFPDPFSSTSVIDSDTTSHISQDQIMAPFIKGDFGQLSVGDYKARHAVILLTGPNDMLANQSLPSTLTALNPSFISIGIAFDNSTTRRYVTFSNGTISQVPLPSAALFFLSGLVGLGANTFRKAKK